VKRQGLVGVPSLADGGRQLMAANPTRRSVVDRAATGILILNKPSGITSRKLVDQVARLLPRSKVGHAGTLDPLATGILIVCIGPATRLVENLQDLPKSYQTLIRLGARSDTLDADGRIEVEPAPRIPTLTEIDVAIRPLVGLVAQQPPAYSALKIQGKRAYDLARAGETPELAARPVRIDQIVVKDFTWPYLELEIDCGGGTYIRSIARDIGDALQCGGYVATLVRHRTGPFTLAQAVDPGTLSAESLAGLLRPALDAVPNLPRLELDLAQVEAIAQGKRLSTRDLRLEPPSPAGPVALVDAEGTLIALGEVDPEQAWVQPRKVLV
jgi:tRNA pseudouridine55 synthase